jgi:predicted PhzF superfamily epimerase YddE/YHI9
MKLHYTTVDVFTSTRYHGNPLAIVRIPSSVRDKVTEDQKQAIAREFNFSETVFLHDIQPNQDFAEYDIFTPSSRLPFAGHPTIGTSIYVAQNNESYASVGKLRTGAGMVPFVFDQAKGAGGVAEVEVPQDVYIHRNRLEHPSENGTTVPIVSIVKGMAFTLVPTPTVSALGAVKTGLIPAGEWYNCTFLDKGSGWDVGYMGSLFYCDLGPDPEDQGRKLLRTRMLGRVEDPGTGSASCALASWLALQEEVGEGEGPFRYRLVQGVEMGRRCDIFVDVRRTKEGKGVEEVRLSGGSVEVMEGVVELEV